jgi:hypothetical protein
MAGECGRRAVIPRDATAGGGQSRWRTNPQMWQVALPVCASNSRKLGQPLVPQKILELVAWLVRRRMRRMAEARPVTDAVVERDIMVGMTLCFLARRDREMCDRLRSRFVECQRAGPGAVFAL